MRDFLWPRSARICAAVFLLGVACKPEPTLEGPYEGGEQASEQAAGAPEAAPEAEPRPPSTIYRSEVNRAVGQGPAYLLRQLGPEPYRDMGKFAGWNITRLFPDDPSLCGEECDLRRGDIIMSVNGNRLERPQDLTKLLEELPAASELTVVRRRDGEQSSHVYSIAEDR